MHETCESDVEVFFNATIFIVLCNMMTMKDLESKLKSLFQIIHGKMVLLKSLKI